MIFFRVDSGEAIGSGHVMRCLTLARQLQHTHNDDIIFLSKPHEKNIIHIIEENGFKVIKLSDPLYSGQIDEKTWLGVSQKDDATEVSNIISDIQSDNKIIIIDHYAIDIIWENIVRPHVKKIIVIDDLASRKHNCDVLLDQNFYLDKETRYNDLVPKECRLILGSEFALLRSEFYDSALNYKFSPEIKKIFVYFGGIDATGMTLRTLNILKKYPNIQAHIVSSQHCSDWNKIYKMSEDTDHFTLYQSVNNMAKLMASCDAAIGAGGTTQWERMIIGIPSFVVSIANNQTKICEDVSVSGYCYYAGSCSALEQDTYDIMLGGFIVNSFLRESFFRAAKNIKFMRPNILNVASHNRTLTARSATLKDAENLFHWRTHPSNRIYSHQSSSFSMDAHLAWFHKVIESETQHLYIISDQGTDVGVVRFDVLDDYNLVSIYLVPDMHNKGYGSKVLQTAEKYFREHVNTKPFSAEILSNNINSIHLFKKLGYQVNKSLYMKN